MLSATPLTLLLFLGASWRKFVKDINLVLRNKRVQFAELALEINGLEAAATALRPISHLLSEEDDPTQSNMTAQLSIPPNMPTAGVEAARPDTPERSKIRRWV